MKLFRLSIAHFNYYSYICTQNMKKEIRNIFSWATLVVASPWLMLAAGGILYAVAYGGAIPDDSVWKDVAVKAADVLVIGVILGYFTNIAKMLGIFKQDLREIVYMEEHLEKRNDLEQLWDRVSKQMFANKFPGIHSQFLQAIKEYFPDNEVTYYNDYNSFTKVEWHDLANHVIKVTDTVSFELIPESKDKTVNYPMRTWTRIRKGDTYQEELLQFTVNGIDREITQPEEYDELGDKCRKREFELKGADKYEVRYVRQKTYNIDADYYIAFRALARYAPEEDDTPLPQNNPEEG